MFETNTHEMPLLRISRCLQTGKDGIWGRHHKQGGTPVCLLQMAGL